MRRRVTHPSKRRLRTWLDRGDPELDSHIHSCARCAAKIEDVSQPQETLGAALRAVLAPPPDLQPRLRSGIAVKMQTREDLRLLVELLGLPAHTVRALAGPDLEPRPASVDGSTDKV